jgi:23S rRNA pseudouridine1911/1915/1917 synthase
MKGDEVITGMLAEGGRLDKTLALATGLSRERIKTLIAEGAVSVDGHAASSASARVQAGLSFSVHIPPPDDPQALPQAIALDIVFEDDALVVVNKPAGMVVHPAAGNADGTLVNALLHHCAGQLSGIGG